MKNRLCINDERLAQYLCGGLHLDEREDIEKHLAECNHCLQLITEAYEVTSTPFFIKYLTLFFNYLQKHKYTLLTSLSLGLSFIYSKYFFQFLLASALLGIKSIVNAKTTKLLILIKDSLKKENKDIQNIIKK